MAFEGVNPFIAPSAPFAALRDVPPLSLRSEGGLASERGSLPLTDARTGFCVSRRREQRTPGIPAFPFSQADSCPAQAPGGRALGDLSRAVGELHSFSRGTGLRPVSSFASLGGADRALGHPSHINTTGRGQTSPLRRLKLRLLPISLLLVVSPISGLL